MSGVKKHRRRKGTKTETEYVIQIKKIDGYRDYSTYNRRTCHWEIPIEEWASQIIAGYEYKRCYEKYRSTRLVKRTITEEIICKGGAE